MEHIVKFSDFCNNPILFENPNLVVRIKDKYYTWKVAAPIFASIMVYGRPLVQVSNCLRFFDRDVIYFVFQSSVDQLCSMHMSATQNVLDPKEGPKQQQQEARYSWFSWRRGKVSREVTPAPDPGTEANKTAETKDVVVKEIMEEVQVKQDVPGKSLFFFYFTYLTLFSF